MRAEGRREPEEIRVQLRRYLRIMNRQRALIVGTAAATLLASLLLSVARAGGDDTDQEPATIPIASPDATVAVRFVIEPPLAISEIAQTADPFDMHTHAAYIASDRVAAIVQEELRIPGQPGSLLEDLQVAVTEGSSILSVSYSAATAEESERVATAFASAYLSFLEAKDRLRLRSEIEVLRQEIERLTRRMTSADGTARNVLTIRLIEASESLTRVKLAFETIDRGTILGVGSSPSAVSSPSPSVQPVAGSDSRAAPSPARSALTGAALGLVLGALLAIARETLDGRIHTKRDVETRLGLHVLLWHGDIPAETDPAFDRALPVLIRQLGPSARVTVTGFGEASDLSATMAGLSRAARDQGLAFNIVDQPGDHLAGSEGLQIAVAPPYLESPTTTTWASRGWTPLLVVDAPSTRESDLERALSELSRAGSSPVGAFLYRADEY